MNHRLRFIVFIEYDETSSYESYDSYITYIFRTQIAHKRLVYIDWIIAYILSYQKKKKNLIYNKIVDNLTVEPVCDDSRVKN